MNKTDWRVAAVALSLLLGGCANLLQPSGTPAKPSSTPASGVGAEATPGAAASEPAEQLDPRFVRPTFKVLEYHEAASDADVARAISDRLRRNLKLPRGNFPKTSEVTVEAMLAPNGYLMSPRIAHGSGHKALDEAVLAALKRAQPLPVTRAMREQDQSQLLKLRFRPLEH